MLPYPPEITATRSGDSTLEIQMLSSQLRQRFRLLLPKLKTLSFGAPSTGPVTTRRLSWRTGR